MEIKRSVIEQRVKRAYKEGRQWKRLDWSYTYCIMIDTDDADIWCDNFTSCGDFKVYHSDTIHKIESDGLTVADAEKNMVNEAVGMLKEAGWEIA